MGDARLAVVGPAGNLHVLTGGTAAELPVQGRWPSWRPGSDEFVLSRLRPGDDSIVSTVDLFDANTGDHLRELHRVPPGVPPFIAPRVPHYACWAPSGERLAIAAPGDAGLTLALTEAESGESHAVAKGGPLFAAWSPDGRHLAVHSGPTLSIVEAAAPATSRTVSENAAAFRTPAWDRAGEYLYYVVPGEPGMNVVRSAAAGGAPEVLARLSGGMAIAFRPGASELTVAITSRPDSGVFDDLYTLDTTGRDHPLTRVLGGPVVAFWWAPGGELLAVLRPHHTGDGLWSLQAYDARYRFVAATEAFLPSEDMRTMALFFDQYGLSHPAWSPAGDAFVVTGRLRPDGVSASFGDPAGPFALRWKPAARQPWEVLEPAGTAVFAPPAV